MYIFCIFTAPVNIRFPPQSITDVSFVVQWDAVINQSVDRYIVSVYHTDDDRNPIQSVTVDQTSYAVYGLTPNTTYTVTIASVHGTNCTGVASAGKKVNTTVSISMVTTSTIHTRSPSISPTTTAESENYVTNTVTVNSVTKLVPTLDVTVDVMSITTLIPNVIATNPVNATGMFITIVVC